MAQVADSPHDVMARMQILNAVDRPLDSMTVNDICRNAGISRQTFYRYFESKYSIASWWSAHCEQFFMNNIGTRYSWEEGTLRHLHILFYKWERLAVALRGHAEPALVPTVVRRREVMLAALRERGAQVDDVMKLCVEVFAEYGTRVAAEMLSAPPDQVDSLAAMTKKLCALVPAPLYQALQHPDFAHRSQIENIAAIDELASRVLNEPTIDVLAPL